MAPWSIFGLAAVSAAAVSVELNVTATTSGSIESDWTTTYYSQDRPLLITNDGGASTGGFHVFGIEGGSPLGSVKDQFTGRTKLVQTEYNIAGKDYLVSIPQTTSVFSLYELPEVKKVDNVAFKALGDWSALCSWRSRSANTYLFLFGKKNGVQYLLRETDGEVELVEIQTFDVPTEFAGCAVSQRESKMLLTPDDGTNLYVLDLDESTKAPQLEVIGEVGDDLTGIAVYSSVEDDYIFAAQTDVIDVFSFAWESIGSIHMTGLDELEIQGLSMHQEPAQGYPKGLLAYAAEADDFQGFGLSSLKGALEELDIEYNTEYDPRIHRGCRQRNPINADCSFKGFWSKADQSCECFAGSTGQDCSGFTCQKDCSSHGACVGPNECKCDERWGGLHCAFLLVEPSHETEANGADGDDPAIWISPRSPDKSRIVTTTKSEDGAGLGVYDLKGNELQVHPSNQPNNVDMIYGFQAGDRTVDLAFAACRGDNTLCLFEMTEDGVLQDVNGGIQPSDAEDEVYGSCVYKSKTTGRQYLFVNEKSARYMQYELTATANGTLHTELVREFVGGSGGQVEGCVTDEDNGWLILGEEPSALWRYDAEPDGSDEGYRIAYVGDGRLFGDVEGVTLVYGKTKDEGFIIVSCQGVSAYNVYRRAHPHDYVVTFTIPGTADGTIDGVTNTDGVTAVGARLGDEYPYGLLVVHDDTNELAGGGADEEASYKLVPLDKILGADALRELNLLDEIDQEWDPRA
ncbi:3-phytase [Emericellopsis atlantica]|uniref:3-phytase n=1 Tax=Emericellopsis atlantica TaxID=2614577 RepID=A0A9P7ZE83_9HYPO|nr:3-phytase [Emericellopsis atlantica]KAG9250116.1 3-phytase [Emericellopsis atlantica]